MSFFQLRPGVVLGLLLIPAVGCGRENESPAAANPTVVVAVGYEVISSQPLASTTATSGRFARVDSTITGIDFVHHWNPPDHYRTKIATASAGGGVAIGDYDGDGWADVFLTRPFGGARLYRNLGDFHFEDVTRQVGMTAEQGHDAHWSTGASFVDIDNDDDLDLYVCGFDCSGRLYINNGAGAFVEQAAVFGLDFNGAGLMMTWADYDRDGDLDAYLATNRLVKQEVIARPAILTVGDRYEMPNEVKEILGVVKKPNGDPHVYTAGQYDRLYRNDDGRFTDVSRSSGIAGAYVSLSAVWWDYNGDGFPDLYVSNDVHAPDILYRNNRDGTFTDVITQAMPHTPWFSMGADVADVNNDGLLDFFATDMSGTDHYKQKLGMGDMDQQGWFLETPTPRQYMRNALYINTGAERFMEAAHLTGLSNSDWTWSPKFADLDSDGRCDLFISNGMTRDWFNSDLRTQHQDQNARIMAAAPKFDKNLAFRNLGDLHFENVSDAWGLGENSISFGAAYGDLDNDGDLDLVVNDFDAPVAVYRNELKQGRRIKLRLHGVHGNTHGLNALVRIEAGGATQTRCLTSASGFMSSNEPMIHFGLGEADQADRLTVDWPSGHVQTFENLSAGFIHHVTEPKEAPPAFQAPQPSPTMFIRSQRIRGARHRETPFNDFAVQALLPNKMSQLGPSLAVSDVDGDGDEDFFLGGSAGQSARLYLNYGENKGFGVTLESLNVFISDKDCEDMGGLFFDAEGDGDLDIYVVSGGVEVGPNDPLLRDRLYLNDGRGRFTKAPQDALPDLRDSGGCVVAADFDRDGDLDLFVGGRVAPGQYPLTPDSRLLRNESSAGSPRFVDVTDLIAPDLRRAGMVTGALWSDTDQDGWLDLMLAVEWGPIKLFRNDQGRFMDRTESAGLADRLGWWNGVVGADVDHDGDMDYIAANFGLNTKYHPSRDKPSVIYFGDFDNTGRRNIVEAKLYEDRLLPVRGKSCSQNAMPFVAEKFPTFHEFAVSDLANIYSPGKLDEAMKWTVDALESGVLINDGTGRFEFRALPRVAQIAPTFGAALVDVNADGHVDLCLAQNFFSPQRETGRMDGGVGLLLLGDGAGAFAPVWPDQSGVMVPNDAKSLVMIDLNDDGALDLLFGCNDDEVVAFENQIETAHRMRRIDLIGRSANRSAIGARVNVHFTDGSVNAHEIYAGQSYLSQNSSKLVIAPPTGVNIRTIQVRWPDGKESIIEQPIPWENNLVIVHPAVTR